MAANTRSTWDPFLFEMRGAVAEAFPTEHPYLAQIHGVGNEDNRVRRFTRDMDEGRSVFTGRKVRHTIILSELAGGGWVTETSTWNAPHALGSDEATLKLKDFIQPFNVSVDVERDSFNNSAAKALAELMKQARIALARKENLTFLGDGTGLVAAITDSATSLTTTVDADTANWDVLLPGTVWDIRTRSDGTDPGNGDRRKIASVNTSTGVITWDTNAQASDGDSGNITHTSSDGIYIPGSYGNCAQGLEQAAAASGTFEGIIKANVPQWQGTDGRDGDTTTMMLSESLLDKAVRMGRRAGRGRWDYGIGHPATIDGYKQSFYAQRQFNPETMKLKSGYSGAVYGGADEPFPLLKDPMHARGKLHLVPDEVITVYGDGRGPDFLDDDGSMFRRFDRTLVKEADLLDRVEQGFTLCNHIVRIGDLDEAA